jgi:Domain of unknown function (DUF4279)
MICNTLITVSLTVTSLTVSPERMAEVLPFTPTKKWHVGDAVGKSMIRRKHNGVVFALPQEVGDHLEPVVLKLLDELEPIKDEFIRAVTNESLNCELSCVAYFTQPPSCSFAVETIMRIAELKVAFDLDLIFS